MLSHVFGHHIVRAEQSKRAVGPSAFLAGAIELPWLPVTMVSAPHHRVQGGLQVLFQIEFAPCLSG